MKPKPEKLSFLYDRTAGVWNARVPYYHLQIRRLGPSGYRIEVAHLRRDGAPGMPVQLADFWGLSPRRVKDDRAPAYLADVRLQAREESERLNRQAEAASAGPADPEWMAEASAEAIQSRQRAEQEAERQLGQGEGRE